MFVFDAIVGNYDRHAGNWGYLARSDSGSALQSPLYDNASTFYPTLSEHRMSEILTSAEEICKRVILFPNSAIDHKGHRLSYYDALMSGFAETAAALLRVVPNIDERRIRSIIDGIDISDVRKTFYRTMLSARLELLVYPAFERAQKGDFDDLCAERLDKGLQMTEADFQHMWQGTMRS